MTYSCGLLHEQIQDDQLKPINSSSVPIRDKAMDDKGGEKESRISVLMARHDDDDDDDELC